MKNKHKIQSIVIMASILFLLILSIGQFGAIGFYIHQSFKIFFGELAIIPELFLSFTMIYSLLKYQGKLKVPFKESIFFLVILIYLLIIKSYLDFPKELGTEVWLKFWGDVQNGLWHPNTYLYSGILGTLSYMLTTVMFGREGTLIFLIFIILIFLSILYISNKKKLKNLTNKLKDKQYKRNRKDKLKSKSTQSNKIKQTQSSPGFIDVDVQVNMGETIEKQESKKRPTYQLDLSEIDRSFDGNYFYPDISCLDEGTNQKEALKVNEEYVHTRKLRLLEVLNQFGIQAQIENIHIGPAVTKFEVVPDTNVKISKIVSIKDNIMMELAVKSLRIEAPIPGKRAVGIEIPNAKMVPVRLKDILNEKPEFFNSEDIDVLLGRNLMGEAVLASLNKMPHLLVAGATGSGKSVCMNSIINSILLSKHPDEVKLLLIDPKKVEFAAYAQIPHLYAPIITDPQEASLALDRVVLEMEERYDVFAEEGVRNIRSYNDKIRQKKVEDTQPMPWIVVIIDELADLMMVAGKEVEMSIQRITQLARAAGIHLIVATQRPSVDVVTGIIKANIPSRIAFAVSSSTDSRTILDSSGAENLLGYGDMLYQPMGEPQTQRVQGVYVSDDEVIAITNSVKQNGKPIYNFDLEDLRNPEVAISPLARDEIFEDVLQFVIREQKASVSLIQRNFSIGYNRAARIIDQLEENGIIGPARGSKPRIVFYNSVDEALNLLTTEK